MEGYEIKIPKSRMDFVEMVYEAIKKGKRKILIYGESGSGRSVLLDCLCRKLEKDGKKILRVITSLGGLMSATEKIGEFDVFVIDDIDIILESDIEMDDLMLNKLFEEIEKSGKTLIVTCEERNLEKTKKIIEFDGIYKIESISFEEFREILEDFWRESFKIFTEEDIKRIYENSKGNLKMAYLISTIIYREKRK